METLLIKHPWQAAVFFSTPFLIAWCALRLTLGFTVKTPPRQTLRFKTQDVHGLLQAADGAHRKAYRAWFTPPAPAEGAPAGQAQGQKPAAPRLELRKDGEGVYLTADVPGPRGRAYAEGCNALIDPQWEAQARAALGPGHRWAEFPARAVRAALPAGATHLGITLEGKTFRLEPFPSRPRGFTPLRPAAVRRRWNAA